MKMAINIGMVAVCAVLAVSTYHVVVVRSQLGEHRRVAVLDVDSLLKEMVVAVSQSGAGEADVRAKASIFRTKLEEAARVIEGRDGVVLLNAAAVVGTAAPDYTAIVREALELPEPRKAAEP